MVTTLNLRKARTSAVPKQEAKLGRAIRNASGPRKLRDAQRRYLHSPAAWARATDEAMHEVARRRRQTRKGGRPYHLPREWRDVTRDAILRSIRPWAPCDEPVRLFDIPKGSGMDSRLITAFGPRNYARQRLVLNCLRHRGQLHPDQFGVPGRDRHKAILRAKDNHDSGFTHVVHLDIVQAYPSFDVEALTSWLSLPKETAAVFNPGRLSIAAPNGETGCFSLCDGSMDLDPASPAGKADEALLDAFGEEWVEARSGLSQGSGASAGALELVLADALRSLAGHLAGVRLVALGDDVLIQGRSETEARAASVSLRETLASHPVGPFHVHQHFGGTAPDPRVRFLGYDLFVEDGALVPAMGERATNKLRQARHGAYQIMRQGHLPPDNRRAHVERVAELHRATVAQFPAWAGRHLFLMDKLGALRVRAAWAGL